MIIRKHANILNHSLFGIRLPVLILVKCTGFPQRGTIEGDDQPLAAEDQGDSCRVARPPAAGHPALNGESRRLEIPVSGIQDVCKFLAVRRK